MQLPETIPANGQSLLKNAQPYRIADYQPCEYLTDILTALAQEHPVAFSMVIYTDFYQARQGVVPDKPTRPAHRRAFYGGSEL